MMILGRQDDPEHREEDLQPAQSVNSPLHQWPALRRNACEGDSEQSGTKFPAASRRHLPASNVLIG